MFFSKRNFREIGKSGQEVLEILQIENGERTIISLVHAGDISDQKDYIVKIRKFALKANRNISLTHLDKWSSACGIVC
jgi:hypothetical protein